jgi:hypothetical protein
LDEITASLQPHCQQIELNRLEQGSPSYAFFIVKPHGVGAIDQMTAALKQQDSKAKITFIKYQPLI